MPNKYYYNGTLPECINEEDREVKNDLIRAQTKYYETLYQINVIMLANLLDMDDDEIKDMLKNGCINPIRRL